MKERYNIKITDIQLTILSDEPEDFVYATVAQLNDRISDLSVKNKRCSKLDAALLCALDSMGEKTKADKKIKNLEAQISLYEATNKRLREELDALRSAFPAAAVKEEAEIPAEEAPAEEPVNEEPAKEPEEPVKKEAAPEEKAQQLSIEDIPEEEPAAEEKAEETPAEAPLHDDKLRQIEQLLRRRSEEHAAQAAPEEKKESEAPAEESSAPATRDEKLRQIEDLLRKNGSVKTLSEVLHNAIGN